MEQKSPEAFRTISEVAEWLGVPTHVLRFWESRFTQVKPVKRAGGRRYYRPTDMQLLGGIRKLLHDDGLTIRGVQKLLREQGVKHVAAMSPPLDADAETNVVSLRKSRESDAEIEDAEIVEAPEAGDTDADLPPAPSRPTPPERAVTDTSEAGPEAETPAPADASDPADTEQSADFEYPEPTETDDISEDVAADTAEDPIEPNPDATSFHTEVTDTEDGDIVDDTLTPETDEDSAPPTDDHAPDPAETDEAQAEPPEPEPQDPEPEETEPDEARVPVDARMETPGDIEDAPGTASFTEDEALTEDPEDMPAPELPDGADAEPVDEGTNDDTGTIADQDTFDDDLPDPIAPSDPETEANIHASETAEPLRPALVMPDIGSDPLDGELVPLQAPVAPVLRRMRARGLTLPPAALRALSDRLETLRDPDRHRRPPGGLG
nr:MerR family transcriptional regulator [Maritimibacter dapengensis]